MHRLRLVVPALALSIAALSLPLLVSPAAAAVDNQEPARFVTTLSADAFATLRGGDRAAAKARFRSVLAQYFAIDEIGDRLIRRWRTQITPAQYAAYKAALPGFLIGTYADRLAEYARSDIRVIRVIPRGDAAVVQSQVVQPGGRPMSAAWTVERIGGGYRVSNLIVAGINVSLTQSADFDSYIQRNGFDKLVAFMKSRG